MRSGAPQKHVIFRIFNAKLSKNFESIGRMDPYAEIEWNKQDGSKLTIARTKTDWNSHMAPVWDHTCRGQLYDPDCTVAFKVYEDDVTGIDTLCGSASRRAAELLPGIDVENVEDCGVGPVMDLEMRESDGVTGTISVQAMLHIHVPGSRTKNLCGYTDLDLTRVAPSFFEGPVQRLGVSGGTAPFFSLTLRNPEDGQSKGHFLGKDLTHATDEVNFYEEALEEKKSAILGPLLAFTFEYAGVFTATVEGSKEQKELLVMRNLRDGCKSLRMLDVKIGQKTAQSGWQGKSRYAAMRQALLDGLTNSSCEGYRLEGFDSPPPALTSMDPLLDVGELGKRAKKKMMRLMYQQMTGAEMFMHFTDVHQVPAFPGKDRLSELLCPTEVLEIALREIVLRLVLLILVCRNMTVPEKWIGSSVGLGYDDGFLPPRDADAENSVREKVKVNIFDWGKSELNTMSEYRDLAEHEQKDRSVFWGYYVGGVDRLAYEAARAYWNRFGNSDGWESVMVTSWDFDSQSSNDFMGTVTLPLAPTPQTTTNFFTSQGKRVSGTTGVRGSSSVTYSMEFVELPAGSALKGVWRINIIKCNALPRRDKMQGKFTSDPYVEVVAVSADGQFRYRQVTSVIVGTLDPEFGETLDIPIAARPGLMQEVLDMASPNFSSEPLSGLLPPEDEGKTAKDEAEAFLRWSAHVRQHHPTVNLALVRQRIGREPVASAGEAVEAPTAGAPDAAVPPSAADGGQEIKGVFAADASDVVRIDPAFLQAQVDAQPRQSQQAVSIDEDVPDLSLRQRKGAGGICSGNCQCM